METICNARAWLQHCCATLKWSRKKRNVGSCWLKSLTSFKLRATTPDNTQKHATGCAKGRMITLRDNVSSFFLVRHFPMEFLFIGNFFRLLLVQLPLQALQIWATYDFGVFALKQFCVVNSVIILLLVNYNAWFSEVKTIVVVTKKQFFFSYFTKIFFRSNINPMRIAIIKSNYTPWG